MFEARRPAMERIFADLAAAGVQRGELQLAWDFTVASTESLTGRMVAMRDDAFAALGDAAPVFTVDTVTENPNPFVRRRIEGTFELPLYLTHGWEARRPAGPRRERGGPQRQPGTFTAHYLCNLPPASESSPARMSMYGHGLLGDRGEVNGDLTRKMSADYNIAYCATDWYGMAEEDVGAAMAALVDLSKFPAIPDRIQQGFLAFLYLGRLMKHPQGFSANDAFRFGGQSALKIDELYFDGNSQGAILGGALTAVAQDFTRSVLGEAGMNYAVLLDRSVGLRRVPQPGPAAQLPAALRPHHRHHGRPVAVGPRRDRRLRQSRHGGSVARHAGCTPCCCSVPWATTRSPSTACGSKPRRSVPQPTSRSRRAGRVAELDPGWLLTPIDQYPYSRFGVLPVGHRLALVTGRQRARRARATIRTTTRRTSPRCRS